MRFLRELLRAIQIGWLHRSQQRSDEIAGELALDLILASWPRDMSYEDVLTAIESDSEEVLVWAPFENTEGRLEAVEVIETCREAILNGIQYGRTEQPEPTDSKVRSEHT